MNRVKHHLERAVAALGGQVIWGDEKPKRNDVVVPYDAIQRLYNDMMVPPMMCAKEINKQRQARIRALWKKGLPSLENWRNYFLHVQESKFLMSKVPPSNGYKQFRGSLDYLIHPTKYLEIKEGKYHG
jgi:hypothetical protein